MMFKYCCRRLAYYLLNEREVVREIEYHWLIIPGNNVMWVRSNATQSFTEGFSKIGLKKRQVILTKSE